MNILLCTLLFLLTINAVSAGPGLAVAYVNVGVPVAVATLTKATVAATAAGGPIAGAAVAFFGGLAIAGGAVLSAIAPSG